MPVICIGPVCVPIWQVWLLVAFLGRYVIQFFKRFWAPREATAEGEGIELAASDNVKLRKQKVVTPIKSLEKWNSLREEAAAQQKPVVVCFCADWCQPCRLIAPFFESLSAIYDGRFCKVDVDEAPEVQDLANASSLPTFQVWTGVASKPVDTVVGALKDNIESLVKTHCKTVERVVD
eukprot:Selendium_serpulae@DN6001_c0_g2_i2.p2